MKTKRIVLPAALLRATVRLFLTSLLWMSMHEATAVDSPNIIASRVEAGKLRLTWTGNSYAYEVQTSTTPGLANWTSILATARTNVLVPLSGSVAFFRVVDPDTNLTRLDLTATNLATGDVTRLSKQPQTNGDLVFNQPGAPSGAQATLVLSGDELKKFDMAFDGAGGFAFVTTNGERTQFGGQMTRSPGPGTNEVTFQGYLADGANLMTFSAVAADPALNVGDAAFSAWYCSSAWAVQNLQCQSAAFNRNLGCFFAGRGGGYGVIISRTGVTVTGTNIAGQCTSHCQTCCKSGDNPPTDCN